MLCVICVLCVIVFLTDIEIWEVYLTPSFLFGFISFLESSKSDLVNTQFIFYRSK